MKIKHIYWFAYFNMFSPSVRYRVKYPLDLLKEKHSITHSFVYPSYNPVKIARFLHAYFSALLFRKDDSLIVIQRVYTNFIYSSALKILLHFQKKHTLYDLDDAEYFDRPSKIIHYFLKNCEAVSVGSTAVKTYVEQFNKKAFLLTSPILAHDIIKGKRNPVFTIGWIGDFGGAHRESMFRLFFPTIKELDFKVRLVILGIRQSVHTKEVREYFHNCDHVIVEIPEDINWQDEMSVYRRVKDFDIGVCPLIDTEITRAKSAFKIKQYFSCGVPALGSDVGENAQFLNSGINGFLCNSPEEFKSSLIKLKEMPDAEYEALSKNAKTSIHQFDMNHFCTALLKFYN